MGASGNHYTQRTPSARYPGQMPHLASLITKPIMKTNSTSMRKARKAARHATEMVNESRGALNGFYEDTRDRVVSLRDEGLAIVRHNPVRTALVSVAVGAVLGFLWRR